MPDPIIEEIRRIRADHAARFDYDVRSIGADVRRRQRERGLPVVTLHPRHIAERSDGELSREPVSHNPAA